MNAAAWFYRQSFNGRVGFAPVAREAQGNGVRREAVPGVDYLMKHPCASPAADAPKGPIAREADGEEVAYGRPDHHLARLRAE